MNLKFWKKKSDPVVEVDVGANNEVESSIAVMEASSENKVQFKQEQSVESVISDIQASAKKMPEIRVVKEIKIGQHARQGDIYVLAIPSIEDSKLEEIFDRQLAPGQSKGSRHIVQESTGVRLFKSMVFGSARNIYRDRILNFQVGPVISATDDFCIMHPEHAWLKMPKGDYQVLFQVDWATKQRVLD